MLWQLFIGSFLGALLGVIGTELGKRLFIPSALMEARRDEAINACEKSIATIEELSASYWNQELDARSREIVASETLINARMVGLSREITELFLNEPQALKESKQDLRRFRQQCTGGDFGGENPEPDKERVERLRVLAADLTRNLKTRRAGLRRRVV